MVQSPEKSGEDKKELVRQYEYLLDQMFKAKVFAAVVSRCAQGRRRCTAELYAPFAVLA